ncbi:D-isomer specific 2-hydroxyacid dehydrogenase-like protein [Arenibacter sp. ARW7G5Y1]|nr:D-isomer specific 2-hydroxyacid dehydrogenase-like protein [Arenibacter sp. ARW7G5Y1]
MDELLERADIISVHVPYNENTHELLDERAFHKMKRGVIFVNTSRGKVVKEEMLIKYLEKKHIGGAVLDVYKNEPKVPPKLRRMSNVILTPHLGGGTKPGRLACYEMAVANVMAVLNGNTPLNPVNGPL